MSQGMSLDFVPHMSNQELAEAILAVQTMLKSTGSNYSYREPMEKHHKMLLEAQAHRAVMFEIKEAK